ncbi:MAG: FtsX-like permease family protein [Candidatus Omnitrophica bacterium]|nr:MAG: ABC transporter permease YtrF precursor [Candidatus Hinthialibacteria bacterium OLB16]MBE7487251.1 ABC transporter permease [bacterium]MBK7493923.1 ABC transporter permease [Candidatus Omnitrophota bacterium]MBV6481743.1 ABC transporter permease YtrF [bacterium]MBW7937716.1 ABC transporter permease [Candidatus Omnitrophota bacterium]
METTNSAPGIFRNNPDKIARQVVLPWRRTLDMCLSNVRNRLGRSFLTFAGIAIVVAFFMSSFCYQSLLSSIIQKDDVHAKAMLERAGIVTHNQQSLDLQSQRQAWLLGLSALLCLAGITNTMLMSVTERIREIGTLKCLGALDRFVVRLFLVESFFIGLLGSLSGAVLGFLLSILQIGAVLEFSLLSPVEYLRCLAACGPVAVLAGTLLAVIAAIYPTYVAARMKPVDAMRTEL